MKDMTSSNDNNERRGAGSGNFMPSSLLEIGTLNPRVLSDMGLAIPRPARLGDPRNYFRYYLRYKNRCYSHVRKHAWVQPQTYPNDS